MAAQIQCPTSAIIEGREDRAAPVARRGDIMDWLTDTIKDIESLIEKIKPDSHAKRAGRGEDNEEEEGDDGARLIKRRVSRPQTANCRHAETTMLTNRLPRTSAWK